MHPTSKKILVTGANRGIGFSIVQASALRIPDATFILACRSSSSGSEAISELRKLGITAKLEILVLDVTSDDSIQAAKETIAQSLSDRIVLVNNAGVAIPPNPSSLKETRDSFNTTFNTNLTSVHLLIQTLLPVLRASQLSPRIINVSSGRASLARSQSPTFPPTAILAYSISKVALNCLTIEFVKAETKRADTETTEGTVACYTVNPGHCKTAFNGFKGPKDPLDGAEIVVRLIEDDDLSWKSGSFLEFEEGVIREIPW